MSKSETGGQTRHIVFDGTRNFRDLGGISTQSGVTRRGIVFRSERLSDFSDADCQRLSELGVKTIIDMRSEEERERAPNRLAPDGLARQIHRPFLPRHTLAMFEAINSGEYAESDAIAAMLRQYDALALEHVADYRQVIDDLLAPAAAPVVFHCTSGKDRTGMVAAILLLALGAERSAIVEDYVITEGRIPSVDYLNEAADPAAIEAVMAAKADYIEAAIAAMERSFGSVDQYLKRGIGIDADKLARLRQLMLLS